MKYEKPTLVDFGTLAAMTNQTGFCGVEDGASKFQEIAPHHSGPLGIPGDPCE